MEDRGYVSRDSKFGRDYQSALSDAIAGLPDRQREVVVMRFLMGQSTSEVAQSLDCPMGTVKSRINRGRTKLQTLLKDVYTPQTD